ncbi:MAG: ABC transporter ATP-binding protein [Planctomycetales bacterium]|nr:ABC transporter ATP-binding protein [Planctomycetales bacterium]
MSKLDTSSKTENRSAPSVGSNGSAEPLRGPHFTISPSGSPAPRTDVSPGEILLSTKGLVKSYRKGQVIIPVLRGVDFAAEQHKITSIIGQSGSGKSTLLHLMGTLDAPDAGEIYFEGNRIDNLPSKGRDTLRNQYFGMIFQFYHLLPELTTLENVLLPMMIGNSVFKYWGSRRRLKREATELLDVVGLSHRLKHRTRELSGGEMQRVAIARALITKPRILLADEPTGNLDEQTGAQIMELLRSLNDEYKLTIVMVTHDTTIAKQSDRVVQLVEGQVQDV